MTGAVFDPIENYYQLKERADQERRDHYSNSLVRIFDGSGRTSLEVRTDIEISGEDAAYTPGGAESIFPLASPEGQFLTYYLDAEEDAHLTVEQNGYDDRISYKALSIAPTFEEDGTELVKVTWINMLAVYEHVFLLPNPALPPPIQVPTIFVIPGNTVTVTKLTVGLNLAHQYAPLLKGIDGIFSKDYWRNSMNPAKWPVVINPNNPVRDTSKGMITAYRGDMALDAMRQSWEDAQCIPTAKLWLPGDRQPFPEFATLTEPTVVLDVELHDGVRGLTGTAVDGWLKLGVSLLDDLIVEVVHPILDPEGGNDLDAPIASAVGLAPAQPWPVYRRGEYSGLLSAESTIHKSLWYTTWTGGRSPEWVNQGIRLAISTALEYIGFSLAIPGLGNLYTGQLDNTVLAWSRHTDRRRARKAGRLAFVDGWEGGAGVGFGLSTELAKRAGWYKSRPHRTNIVEVIDCAPYPIGTVIKKGTRTGFEMPDGSIYVDMVSALRWRRARDSELRWSLVIGDDKDEEDPIAALYRLATSTRSALKQLFLGG